MLFSILVPVFNVEKYLEACLCSLQHQSYEDFEVILVDDGSKDRSAEICNDYVKKDSRFRVIHKDNEGLISARREGIKKARGQFCIFCDSDDFLNLDALLELSKIIFTENPDLILYEANQVSDEGKILPFFKNVLPYGRINNKELIYDTLLLSYKLNSLCLKAVKRTIIDIHEDYSSYYKCNFGEDILQSIPLIINAENIFYINKPLYNYRVVSGMMHKYSPNYYTSYKMINCRLHEYESYINISDFSIKTNVHLLVAAYGAVSQFRFLKNIDRTELDKILNDETFRAAYITVKKSCYWKCLNKKQQILLAGIYKKCYLWIHLLITLGKFKNLRIQ